MRAGLICEKSGSKIILSHSISVVGDTYAQWVRRAVKDLEINPARAISLFESSVPEPTELMRQVVERSFSDPMTTRYKSVFTESNPYVIAALSKRYDMDPRQVFCVTGATGAIALLYKTFLNPGDHVLVETPGFDIFSDFVGVRGAKADTFARPAPDFAIDPKAVAAKIKPNTRFIVLSNLHNPSGAYIPDETLAELADLAADAGVMVIVDEVYRDYIGGDDVKSVGAKLRPNIITVSSLTKIYGLSALRCGWIIAAPEVVNAVRTVSDVFEFNVSKLAHAVAAEVLEDSATFDKFTHDIIREARPIMEGALKELEGEGLIEGNMPEHGCICFPKVVGVDDTLRLTQWLVDVHDTYVVPGEYFGAPGYFRLGFAHRPEKLITGMSRLMRGLTEYARLPRIKSSVG